MWDFLEVILSLISFLNVWVFFCVFWPLAQSLTLSTEDLFLLTFKVTETKQKDRESLCFQSSDPGRIKSVLSPQSASTARTLKEMKKAFQNEVDISWYAEPC